MAITDFTIDTSGTPQDVQRKQALADALMKQGMDSSPAAGGRNGGWLTALNRGLAGALGGYQRGQADQMSLASRQADQNLLSSYPGLSPTTPSNPIASALTASTGKSADTSGKIYNNDEPSPLDPPSGEDRRKMMATILGEENSAPGQAGVASVIRNRAVDGSYGGDTPSAVVTAKNQFEPWNTEAGRARMAAALADPKQAAAADNAIKMAYGEGGKAPEDPTEGKTMFYSPGAQAALGRPAPAWAKGEGQKLGQTMFYDDNSETPSNSQPAQGQLPQVAQADPQAAHRQELIAWAKNAMLSNNPQTRQLALQTMEQLNKPASLVNAGGGKLYDPASKTWISAPQTETDKNEVKVLGKDGELYKLDEKGNPVILHKNAPAEGAATIDDKTADLLANRILQGDTKAMVGLGRGAQGAANILAVQKRAAEIAAEKGIDAKGIIDNAAQNAGLVSASRALGTKETHFGVAEKAMEESLPIAQAASDAVPRTDWVHLNKMIQAGQTEHASPTLKRFLIATDTAAKDYARTINPTGALRESDIEYARKILSTSDGPEAYKQGLDQLRIEAGVMHRAIQRQKDELHGKKSESTPKTEPAKVAGPQEGDVAHNPQTGETIIRKGGKWVPLS